MHGHLFGRGIRLAGWEAAGHRLEQGVGDEPVGDVLGGVAVGNGIPRRCRIEHGGEQPVQPRVRLGVVAEPLQSQRGGEPAGRIDGEHQGAMAGFGGGHTEGGGNRRLADPAASGDEHCPGHRVPPMLSAMSTATSPGVCTPNRKGTSGPSGRSAVQRRWAS